MREYLLPADGQFYKVNMHCHTVFSDGKTTPEEVKAAYKAAGYSAVAFTEHEGMLDQSALTDDEFIAITSFEYSVWNREKSPFAVYDGPPHTIDHTECVHINLYSPDPHDTAMPCYNPQYLWGNIAKYESELKYVGTPDFERKYTVESLNEVIRAAHERNMLVVFNHPHWSLNDSPLYTKLEGLDGFEIDNGTCTIASDLDYTPYAYDYLARAGKRMPCVAGDDNHNPAHYFHAWTMVKAPALTYDGLFNALRKGECYASSGPEIYDLYVEDSRVYVRCSAAAGIFLTTIGRRKDCLVPKDENERVTEASFRLNPEDYCFRITIRDSRGRHANSRFYYLDELKEKIQPIVKK